MFKKFAAFFFAFFMSLSAMAQGDVYLGYNGKFGKLFFYDPTGVVKISNTAVVASMMQVMLKSSEHFKPGMVVNTKHSIDCSRGTTRTIWLSIVHDGVTQTDMEFLTEPERIIPDTPMSELAKLACNSVGISYNN